MSSPITNLRKTSLTSEKIIKNGLEFRKKGPITMEGEVYYVRRNSPPDLIDKENLILNMTNRLASLENEMMGVRLELSKAIEVINRKDAEIAMLKQQLYQQGNQPVHLPTPVADKRVKKAYREYNEGYTETPEDYYDRSNINWEEKYYDLSDRVAEMEKFLADYGMIWVGDKKCAEGQNGIIQTAVDFVPDFDKVIAVIGELNERISSESHIKVVGNEARFQKADILNITFYKDGMKLENNPFRKYSMQSSLAFFRDLEDGYYPTELKESYPEGVIFQVTDKRSMPYKVSTLEGSIFKSLGYRLGKQASSIEQPNQNKVYFQFDTEAQKEAFHKAILKKKPFIESVFPVALKRDNIDKFCDSNESRHDGLPNLPYNINIKKRGNKGYVVKISSCKQILKKCIKSKDKLIKNKRDKKNVVFEKSTINFKHTGVRYHVPFESQSVPTLHRNANEYYYPTGHPQQSRTYKQQEYGGYINRGRGPEMGYETGSPGTPDSTTMGTIFDDSYNRDDYKKKIYDATAALAQKRKSLRTSPFDTDEEYEHMVILRKKKEKNKTNNGDSNAVGSLKEETGIESKTQIDSEYDEYSHNLGEIRKSINERAAIRNSIKDHNDLQKTFNENMIQQGRLNGKFKSNMLTDSENDVSSRSIEEVREPINEQTTFRKNIKDPHGLQNTLNEAISHEGQHHSNIKPESPPDSEYDAYSRNIKEVRKSIDGQVAIRKNIKDPHGLQNIPNENISHEGQHHSNIKLESPPGSEYDAYSHNIKEVRKSINERAAIRNSINDPRSLQNTFNDNRIQGESNGRHDRKSFSEVQVQRPNTVPSYDQKSNRQATPNMKTNAPNEDEMRMDTSLMDTEYKRKYSQNIDDIAGSIEKRRSVRFGSVNPHDNESEEVEKKFKGYDVSNIKKRLSDGKVSGFSNVKCIDQLRIKEVPSKKKLLNKENSHKAKSKMITYDDHEEESRERSFISPYAHEDDGYQEEEQMQNKSRARSNRNSAKQHLEEKEYNRDMIPLNNEISQKQEQSNITFNSETDEEYSRSNSPTTTEYEDAYGPTIEDDSFIEDRSRHVEKSEKIERGDMVIIKSNKESENFVLGEEGNRSPLTSEYEDAYGSKIEDDTFIEDRSSHVEKSGKIGRGDMVIINSNKESENFVLGKEGNRSPLTSEYRDAYGTKFKYVIHQCSNNLHGDQMLDNRERSVEANLMKLLSKGKVYEPKVIPLNCKTSDGQIELNMKSCNGNEIYSAYLYPDDSISKIWSLTELNYDEFVVTVEDKVLHINVPLKNYNINGDVTLNISKRKPSFKIKKVDDYRPKSFSEERDVDYSSDEDYFSDKVANEEGYSS